MKAIHNVIALLDNLTETVFNTSKIQNESNSQRETLSKIFEKNCVQYVKDTK